MSKITREMLDAAIKAESERERSEVEGILWHTDNRVEIEDKYVDKYDEQLGLLHETTLCDLDFTEDTLEMITNPKKFAKYVQDAFETKANLAPSGGPLITKLVANDNGDLGCINAYFYSETDGAYVGASAVHYGFDTEYSPLDKVLFNSLLQGSRELNPEMYNEVLYYEVADPYHTRYAEFLAANAKELNGDSFGVKEIIMNHVPDLPEDFFKDMQEHVVQDKDGKIFVCYTGIDFAALRETMDEESYDEMFAIRGGLSFDSECENVDEYQTATYQGVCIDNTDTALITIEEMADIRSSTVNTLESTSDIVNDIEALRPIFSKHGTAFNTEDSIKERIADGTITNAGLVSALELIPKRPEYADKILNACIEKKEDIKVALAEALGISEDVEQKARIDICNTPNGISVVARDFNPNMKPNVVSYYGFHDTLQRVVESELWTAASDCNKRLLAITPTNEHIYAGEEATATAPAKTVTIPKSTETTLDPSLVSQVENDVSKQNEGNDGLG